MAKSPYPFGHHSPGERARTCLRMYRDALAAVDPGLVRQVDEVVTRWGQRHMIGDVDPEASVLNETDSATLVGMSPHTLARYRRAGQVEAFTSEGQWFYRRAELAAFKRGLAK